MAGHGGDSNERKAIELMQQAEKKKSSGKGLFSMLGGGSSKQEEACELYCQAANFFKLSKNWSGAGNAFCLSAGIHLSLQNKHDAASNFVDAGTAFKKTDPNEAVKCYKRAVEIFTDMGRFSMAAKHLMTVAEIYELQLSDIDKAISHYEQSADFYKGEESISQARKCLLKVAHYAAKQEKYQKAIELFESTAVEAMDSTLLKYSCKEYFYKAALCHLALDVVNAQQVVRKYTAMFPAFTDSREYKLVVELMDAVQEQDTDKYTAVVADYDKISRLDDWNTTMLLRIKKLIEGEEGGGDLR